MTGRQAAAATCLVVAGRERTSYRMGAVRTRVDRVCKLSGPQVTFTRDVAPILFNACASCHRPEGIAPFSLLTYEDAKSHAAAIVAATRDRVMPPWKPEPGYGEFLDERRLTDDQIATLARWVDGGRDRRRSAQLPCAAIVERPVAARDAGSRARDRSLHVARIGRRHLSKLRAADRRRPPSRYIRAWEFLPGSGAVHHATMQFDPTRSSRRLDEQDPEPGYEGLVPHSAMSPDGYFLGWLPGLTSNVAPAWNVVAAARLAPT